MLYSVIGLPACFCIFHDKVNNTFRPMIEGQFIKEIAPFASRSEAEQELMLWWLASQSASLCEG